MRPHQLGEPRNIALVVLCGKSKAQPRGTGRHGGRTDRDDKKTVVAKAIGCRQRRSGVPDDHRNDGALGVGQIKRAREEARLSQRLGGVDRVALDHLESGNRRGDHEPAAGRSSR